MKKYYVLFLSAGLLAACDTEEPPVTEDPLVLEDTAEYIEVEPVQYFYQVPTPDELFSFIIEAGNDPRPDLLNPASNADSYVNKEQKSFNFGVYSTDLAYASHYNQGQQTLEYFKVVNELGNELNISGAFNESMKDRISDNQENVDSLLTISKETYHAAYNYLEENEQGAELSMVVAGGWAESLYIVSQSTPYKEKSPVVQRIAEQKYSLENIIEFLKKFEDDQSVASVLQGFMQLKSAFDAIEEKEVPPSENEGERVTLGGTRTELVMSKDQYEALKTAIADLRNSMTGNNS